MSHFFCWLHHTLNVSFIHCFGPLREIKESHCMRRCVHTLTGRVYMYTLYIYFFGTWWLTDLGHSVEHAGRFRHPVVNLSSSSAGVDVGQKWSHDGEVCRQAVVHVLLLHGQVLSWYNTVGGHLGTREREREERGAWLKSNKVVMLTPTRVISWKTSKSKKNPKQISVRKWVQYQREPGDFTVMSFGHHEDHLPQTPPTPQNTPGNT